MVSLWGSKRGEDNAEEEREPDTGDGRRDARHSGGAEPDERTRLLPPRNDGYLDPDDPAVSALMGQLDAESTLTTASRSHPITYGP